MEKDDSVPASDRCSSSTSGREAMTPEAEEPDRTEKRRQRHYEKRKEKRKTKRATQAAEKLEHKENYAQHDEPPSHDQYEVQVSPRKGLGLFASVDIERGTRILSEPALIHLSPGQISTDIVKCYNSLSRRKQREYTDLCSTANPHQGKDEPMSEFDQHIINIFNANSTLCADGRAIFNTAARINHDCTPNIVLSTRADGEANFCVVHAIRKISTGEELLAAYTDVCQGAKERAHGLQLFRCACRLCNDANPAAIASAQRRSRLALLKMMLRDEDSYPAVIQKAATEMMDLLEKEGLIGVDLAFAYNRLTAAATSQNNRLRAKVWKKRELDLLVTCYGDEHAESVACARELKTLDW